MILWISQVKKHQILKKSTRYYVSTLHVILNKTENTEANHFDCSEKLLGFKMRNLNNGHMPDISVPLDIEVVKIVCVFNLAKVWTL